MWKYFIIFVLCVVTVWMVMFGSETINKNSIIGWSIICQILPVIYEATLSIIDMKLLLRLKSATILGEGLARFFFKIQHFICLLFFLNTPNKIVLVFQLWHCSKTLYYEEKITYNKTRNFACFLLQGILIET